ncbi:polysaccharide deacetylase family protein [Candidatus Electronema sp. JM]|uniref:polysaccharide deacetylase family protein n=1 Tax=Candidatus Electronema sp. JM TaxID=3401571 RepID=UPI003AA89364
MSILLGIDLEDVRDWVENGHSYREAVPETTRIYLKQFKAWGVQATFFVVGNLARRYPQLIAEIAAEGHEIACHGDRHLQLDKLGPQGFREDLQNNLAALRACGVRDIYGFRAPTFSLTKQTAWAHEVLSDLGFTYSSSVLPAKNPLYGWPEFGRSPRKTEAGCWELPVTLLDVPGLRVPAAGGVYFRVLPFLLTNWSIKRTSKAGQPVLTYFHPYDIDTKQERFMHPDLGGKKHLNLLMYIGRARLLPRLDKLRRSLPLIAYRDYVVRLAGGPVETVADGSKLLGE